MTTLISARIKNGEIAYVSGQQNTPLTSETMGSVTIENPGSTDRPAHFMTPFLIEAQMEAGGIKFSNVLHWNGVVLGESDDAPYRQVEDKAARTLAPMLRAFADQIEQEIARFDEKRQASDHQS